MKKVLFATTALVLTAGVAAAEVKFSGTARVGLQYVEDRGGDDTNVRDTQVNLRLRFNIDAYKELDSGVTLGGRIRVQYQQNQVADFDDINGDRGGATLSAAYVYAEANGFRVEVGNANGALDSMATLYNSEFGFIGTTQGSYNLVNGGDFAAFSSGLYGDGQRNRMGLFASYEVGGFVGRISYHTPDQTVEDLPDGVEDEVSISLDYTSGPFAVGFGYVTNAGFGEDNDAYVLTGEYAINDDTAVGLHYINYEDGVDSALDASGVTLYGKTSFNGIGAQAFISTNDQDDLEDDIAYGIGADYDLGGATLAGTIQRGFDENMYADVGINFSF